MLNNFYSFSDHLLAVLWPRFHHILELNTKSVRDCNTQKLGTIDTRPHYVSCSNYVVCVSVCVCTYDACMQTRATRYKEFGILRKVYCHIYYSGLLFNKLICT